MALGSPGNQTELKGDGSEKPAHTRPRDRRARQRAGTIDRAREGSSAELNRCTVERRAVDAVIWGLPLVGEDAVKQAAFRDGKATYNDIVWWPQGGGWKNQSPPPRRRRFSTRAGSCRTSKR
jgi:hypothetical protein